MRRVDRRTNALPTNRHTDQQTRPVIEVLWRTQELIDLSTYLIRITLSQNCRVCSDCGSRTPGSGLSSRWHNNYSVCDSCYQQRNKGLCCPLCGKAYRTFNQQKSNLVTCAYCKKCVHAECDPDMPAEIQNLSAQGKDIYGLYCCPICKERGPDEVSWMI